MHIGRDARPILSIIALCLLLRVVFLVLVHPWTFPAEEQLSCNDSPLYHQLACTLLDYHRFAPSATAAPDPLRTPAYPIFVSGIYAVFGRVPWLVFIAQILLDCLSCYLIFKTLQRVLDARVAHIAAFFFAIDPFLILHTSAFLTETLFIFLLVIVLHIYGRISSDREARPRILRYGLLGLIIGVAALVRPIALYLPIVLVAFILAANRKRIFRALQYSGILVLAFAVVVTPWLLRNYTMFGRAALTYIDSWDLLALNVGAMEAVKRHQDLRTTSDQLLAEADALIVADGLRPEQLNLMHKADYWRRLAFRYILRDPVHFAMAHAKGTIFVFANLGTSDLVRFLHLPPHSMGEATSFSDMARRFFVEKSAAEIFAAALVAPLLLITYVGLVVGLIVGWRRYDRRFLAFCLVITLYFVAVPGALGVVRFKLPAMPFFLGFVGIGIAHLLDRWRVKRAAAIASQ